MKNSKRHSKRNLELLRRGRCLCYYMAYGMAIMLVVTFHQAAVAAPPGRAPVLGFPGGYLDIGPMGQGTCIYWYHLPPEWGTEWRARLDYEIDGNVLTFGKVEVAEALKGRRIGSLLFRNMEVPDTVTVVRSEWREDNLKEFNRAYRFGEDTPEGRLAAGNETPDAKLWKKLGWQLESVDVEDGIPSVEYSRIKPKVELPLSPPRPQPCSSTKPEFSVDLESGVRPLTQRVGLLGISGVSKVGQRPGVVVGPASGSAPPAQVDLIIGGKVVHRTDSRGNWTAGGPGGGGGYRAGVGAGLGLAVVQIAIRGGYFGEFAQQAQLEADRADAETLEILENQIKNPENSWFHRLGCGGAMAMNYGVID